MKPKSRLTSALTIAGSDSAGAAGLQVDLKTFAAFGVHGVCAATAVTAQNMHSVISVHRVPAREVERQLQALFADFRIRAVKIGMLGSSPTVAVVARVLRQMRAPNIVLDPVLASTSGTPLLSPRGIETLRKELIPLARVLTPNLPEAEALLGRRIKPVDASAAARDLLALGARAVLLKGGHGQGRRVCDILADRTGVHEFQHDRLPVNARGTGCALASALAAGLALGQPLSTAVQDAETFLLRALRANYRPGRQAISALGLFARP